MYILLRGDTMNFHSTIAPRIREIFSACTVEHRATLYYSSTNCAVGVDNTVVMDKNEKINHENRNL